MTLEINSANAGQKAVVLNYLVNHLFGGRNFVTFGTGFKLPAQLTEYIGGAVIDSVKMSVEERAESKKWYTEVLEKRPGFVLIIANQL